MSASGFDGGFRRRRRKNRMLKQMALLRKARRNPCVVTERSSSMCVNEHWAYESGNAAPCSSHSYCLSRVWWPMKMSLQGPLIVPSRCFCSLLEMRRRYISDQQQLLLPEFLIDAGPRTQRLDQVVPPTVLCKPSVFKRRPNHLCIIPLSWLLYLR